MFNWEGFKIKQKRIELLDEVNKLLPQICDKCKAKDHTCNCKVAKRIRQIGRQLDKLVPPRAWDDKMQEIKRRRWMTVSDFIDFMIYDVPVKDIQNALGVGRTALAIYCQKMGLLKSDLRTYERMEQMRKTHGRKIINRETILDAGRIKNDRQ